eukprot:CAMPEP_0185746162 /NCGR_PEP_ID=MMETSP1174-20130828/4614_1 /TAXON_ID=35687 /ORGANISM="Dictyocha speculum, Strain CCMP1381" /LENGTH=245 /DNA_ID=CAMNT_0028420607 /DNA_START=48 /DNA_END=786 /DNA_ORIENTATION=+
MKSVIIALAFCAGCTHAFTPVRMLNQRPPALFMSEEIEEVAEEVPAEPEVSTPAPVSTNAFESAIGAQPPLGCFDPLGMLDGADQERFDRLRFVELKHGRICMLGVAGWLTTAAGVRLPGNIDLEGTSFSSIGGGFNALSATPTLGLAQIFLFVGALELFVMKDEANGAAPGDFPGDFRNGALDFGWDTFSEEEQTSKRAIELNNGRAAQMGLLGLMVHDKLGNVLDLLPSGAAINSASSLSTSM